MIWFGVPKAAMILSRGTPTLSRFGSSCADVSFMVAFCSNAVGLRRCAGSKRDADDYRKCEQYSHRSGPPFDVGVGTNRFALIPAKMPSAAQRSIVRDDDA